MFYKAVGCRQLEPPSLNKNLGVDDINATTEEAKSLGATVMKEVTEVGDAGWLSIISDPTGAPLGLWNPKVA